MFEKGVEKKGDMEENYVREALDKIHQINILLHLSKLFVLQFDVQRLDVNKSIIMFSMFHQEIASSVSIFDVLFIYVYENLTEIHQKSTFNIRFTQS